MVSQQQSQVTATVDGKSVGEFETRSDVETSAEPGKYRPGGMRAQKARSALPEHANCTIGREWERERDLDLERTLRARAGRAPMSVTDQPLDDDGAPYGKPTTFVGKLMSVSGGEANSNSNDAKPFTLGMIVTEVV